MLYPTAGYTFQINLSPSYGDQDLYVYSNGYWSSSVNYGQYADSVTFRATSSDPVYIAVHGYIGGSYDIWAAYGY